MSPSKLSLLALWAVTVVALSSLQTCDAQGEWTGARLRRFEQFLVPTTDGNEARTQFVNVCRPSKWFASVLPVMAACH